MPNHRLHISFASVKDLGKVPGLVGHFEAEDDCSRVGKEQPTIVHTSFAKARLVLVQQHGGGHGHAPGQEDSASAVLGDVERNT